VIVEADIRQKRFIGCFLSFIVILVAIPGSSTLAITPTPAYTTPFRIEKVDYPPDTYTGTHISLKYNQVINRAYISYYDATNHDLRLANNFKLSGQGSCNGIVGNWTCQTLDGDGLNGHSADDVGMHSSVDITLVAFIGVGISYYDKTLEALKYAQYACAFNCILSLETIDDPGGGQEAGSYGTALKYDSNGNPYIAYSYTNLSDHTQDALKVAYRVSSGGNCGDGPSFGKWQCDVIDRGTNQGHSPSINLVENPVLSIQLAFLGNQNVLEYAISNSGENCAPGTAPYWACYFIDYAGGGDVSIAAYNDVPSIAYYDPLSGDLRFATYTGPTTDANCGVMGGSQYQWRCEPIEPIGKNQSRASVSLAFDGSGCPAIAYQTIPDFGPSTLKIARPLGAYNYDVGNCGPVPPGGFMPTWLCTTVDGGGAYTYEAAFASIGLRNNGLAIIAYTEQDDYNLTQRLMVAMQTIYTYLPTISR
jgi:hypothetical protein